MSKISFAEHTLGEVIGIAVGMGIPVPPRDRVRRGALETAIQREHTAACNRENAEAKNLMGRNAA